MRFHARSRRLACCWSFLLCAAMVASTSHAQQDPTQPAPTEQDQAKEAEKMSIEIDLDRLLFENQAGSFQDKVWQLQPTTGKRILLLPFTVDNIERPNKLSRFPISVRTGRFIGFVIPTSDVTNRGADDVDLNRIIRSAPGELQALLFEQDDEDAAGQANNSPDEDAQEPTPESAPRLSREILLHPDGTVQWTMARSFHAAQLQQASEQNPYAYKIDPEQLRAAQPERAERLTRNEGEGSRAFAQRKREQQLAEREKQNTFRALRDTLRKLPETFREPRPAVLYAAIEVSATGPLALEGPSPLPWTLDDEKKQLFEQLARGGNTLENDQGENIAGSLVTMIKGHPLDARAVALATMRNRLASQVKTDDPGYEILTRLLQSNDVPTRRIALVGVARVTPPTLASAKLIGVAGEAALGEERKMLSFASLGKLFSTQSDDPDDARVLIDRVSKTIADPEGPAAPDVIEQVLDSLSHKPGAGPLPGVSDTTAVMIEAIDLSGVEPDEHKGVATEIIRNAPASPVAAGWLDQKLLGSQDAALVNQTLALLSETQIKLPAPEVSGLEEAMSEPAPEADTLVLSATIPIARPEHALVALLSSEDDHKRSSAWSALGRFHLDLPEPIGTLDPPDQVPDSDSAPPIDPTLVLFDAILAKADALENRPVGLVAFLVYQTDPAIAEAADARMVGLLSDPDLAQETALAALQAYLDAPERYTQAIRSLESLEKQKLMQSMYRTVDQEAPLISGLIADNGETLAWLNGIIKEGGKLPTLEQWVGLAETRGEATLVQTASSGDDTLATASASALVLGAGGTTQQEISFAQTVALMESRQIDQVQQEWNKSRSKIFADAFHRAQGKYQLVVTLVEAAADQATAQPAEEDAGKRIDLGVVQFQAQGAELSLSADSVQLSPTPSQLGIRIDSPASLRSFSKPELTAIAPEHLSQPMDLFPQDDGGWLGEASLPNGRTIRVSLEPAE